MFEIGSEKFKDLLATEPLPRIVTDIVFKGTPYILKDAPNALATIKTHLASALPLAESNIAIIGSAKMGFSLDPENFPRQFSDASDIDVLIVDERLFDKIWSCLLDWHYDRDIHGTNWDERHWISERRKSIYWGWLAPADLQIGRGINASYLLRPIRDLRTAWFNAFKTLSRLPELSRRDVSGRLYRTWDHAVRYQVDGLRKIKLKLQSQKGG
jgi:hypothetical protein